MSSKELGKLGEDIAADFLKKKGYLILERNYVPLWIKSGRKEIDIVSKKNGVLVFVEVKTIRESQGFEPEDRVDLKKQKILIQLGECYIQEKRIKPGVKWQIDTVGVKKDISGNFKINHMENAVSGNLD